jgi:hypothetical protein
MSFDALLSILFILLFVVGPLLRRLGGGRQAPEPPRPGRRPNQAPPGAEEAEQSDGALGRRLEEARRRVLEAMGEEGGPVAGESSSPERQAQQRDSLDWQETYVPAQPFLTASQPALRRRKATTPDRTETVRTERRRDVRQPARLRRGRQPALDRSGIVSGVMWHEILSEPVSRRGSRRLSSRLRSR